MAALDFSLAYDPAVFQPVSISPGAAASAAGKVVTANLSEPGKYIVVMMGFNQTPIANGEVARIVLERVGTAAQGETSLTVNDPTLSSWEGVELPAEGGTAAVTVTPKADEKPGDEDTAKPGTEKPEKPTGTTEGETQGAKPRNNALQAAAGEVNENSPAGSKPKNVSQVNNVSQVKMATASRSQKSDPAAPDVAAAAARAEEARNRLGEDPASGYTGPEKNNVVAAKKRDGEQARSTDTPPSGSFKIEASDTVNNNTAGSTQPGGAQRTGAAAGGWIWPGLAALVLLAVAVGAWFLRSRTVR